LEKGWIVEIDYLTASCEETLKGICRNLGPHARKLLARRIVTSNPEVKEALKRIGLLQSNALQE